MASEFAKSNYGTECHNISTPTVHRFYQHKQDGIPCAGSLLKQFKASDSINSDPSLSPTVQGCSFCPHDDNLLLTVTGFQSSITAGYVQMWDLNGFDEDNVTPCPVSCIFFTYSPLPACQFSSDGGFVTAILNNGVNRLSILAMDEDDELTPCNVKCEGKNLLTGRVKCCVFSQDNQKAVTVSTDDSTLRTFNRNNMTEICIWRRTSRRLMKSVWRGRCELLCPEFRGNVHSCVVSPNCDYVVISSDLGQSVILDCNGFDAVSPTNCTCVPLGEPVGPLTCLFNPKFTCKLLFCHNNTWCCLRDLEMGCHHQGVASYIVEDQSVTANACRFSLDGDLLAVALSNASVVLCDARTLGKVFEIKPSFSLTQASSLAITRSCQELAVGYNNGSVCIWQLPAKLLLKHLCRMVIIKLIPPNKIPLLPLPRKLKAYLLYKGCNI